MKRENLWGLYRLTYDEMVDGNYTSLYWYVTCNAGRYSKMPDGNSIFGDLHDWLNNYLK